MQPGEGLISKTFGWIFHASNSDETLMDWIGGLVVVLIVSFLWTTVIRTVD